MDSSSTAASDKNGSETSVSVDTTIQKHDSTTGGGCPRDKRRREHNDSEKKRKEQIKACICRMGELLPPSYITSERHSTLEIVEKSLAYMRELKEARTKFGVTEETLQEELGQLRSERDKYLDIIKAAGLSTETLPTNGVSSTTDVKAESPKPLKSKSKKKNSVSSQLQQMQDKRDKLQQQEMISSSVSASEDGLGNMPPGSMMNMASGPGFMNSPMFNPMMMQAGNQFMMPGMLGGGNQMMPGMGMMGPGVGLPGMQQPNSNGSMTAHTPNSNGSQGDGNMNRSMEENDAGLLQLAMQDAGITPSSGNQQNSSSSLTPSMADTQEAESSCLSQNNPLQTLAHVATSNHEMLTDGLTSGDSQNNQSGSNTQMSSNNQTVSLSASGTMMPNMIQTGNQSMLGVPGMGNQGPQQMQQIMFINEQGIPMIAQVPVGFDPNNPNMTQKQGIIQGQNQSGMMKDHQSGIDQNALAMAQQHAVLQSQMMSQGSGASFQSMMQQGLIQGNLIQTPSGQILQQIGPQLPGQGQFISMNSQGQSIMVAGQQGPMTLNTMMGQPNQLPSALILPNGQIVPVVTNPGPHGGMQGQMPRISGPHIQTGPDGQLMSGPSSQGLLIPATASTAASLSTSVMPTSAIQSVMTTQIQGSSVPAQKTISSSHVGSMPSLAHSAAQPKLVAGTPGLGGNLIGVQTGGKQAPILISLPINGQPTTVLLDPTTMQVLGTVNAQQTNQPMATSLAGMATTSITSQAPTSGPNLPSTVGSKKNCKNNANQRAICPKPLGPDGLPLQSTPAKKKKPSKASSKTKETAQADSLSDTLQIQIPESTTDPESTSAISSESTDILAKAAESIFSSPTGEVASVGGFYNPANEDNPLHIDTGVSELEDDRNGSKQFKKVVRSSNSVTESVVNSVAGEGKSSNVCMNGSKVVMASQVVINTSMANADNVTSLSNTLEEIAGLEFEDMSDNFGQSMISKSQTDSSASGMDKNEQKKTKASKSNDSKKESGAKSNKSSTSKSKTKKNTEGENNSLMDVDKLDTDSQMDIESTLIHIPENMTFSENDLSDVLDQVEQFGNNGVDSLSTKLSKKSKTKRSKASESENEPNSKKRKSGKEPAKEIKPAAPPPQRELLSMPANLSVYDFEDSVDIVPSLLPLNNKDFSSSGPGTPTKPDLQKVDPKNKSNSSSKSKNSAQKNANVLKGGKISSSKDDPSSLAVDVQDKDSEKKQDKDKKVEGMVKTSSSGLKVSETLHSMPENDTTTSLFGYPVPKKIQHVDMAGRQNKMAAQVSPKPSPQASVPMASPKQNLVSPKSTCNVVSPYPSRPFSPELVSPKLSIVSPSQVIMSASESIGASPKQTLKDTSPLKKRSPPDKNNKVSSLSALNMSPVLDHVNNMPLSSKQNDNARQLPNASVQSQSMGVITSTKNTTSNDMNKNSVQSSYNNMNDKNLTDMKQSNASNSGTHNLSTASAMPHQTMRTTPTNMDQPFNPNMNINQTPRSKSSVNSSQSGRYGPSFASEANYGQMSGMNRSMPKDTGVGINNYSAPYSAESLFNSQSDKVIKSPPNVNISTLNQPKPDNPMSKVRNNTYSVDSFVQSSRERPDSLTTHAGLMSGADYPNPTTDLARLQNESSPDGFHFTNIGLNLPPITSTVGNYMDNTSNTPINNSSSFSFSLSSSSKTVSSSSSGLGQHQFPPFFPPVLSSASNTPSSQTGIPSSLQSMDMFDNRTSDALQRNRHPSVNTMTGGDNSHMNREGLPHSDKAPASMSDNSSGSQNDKPSCSKQKLPKASGPATIQESFPFNSSSSAHDPNFFRDTQMKSNVGKSPNEQMRKPPSQDKSMDIASQSSRSGSQDKRASNMDRSPQMMNHPQSYYSSTYQPSKSLTTPPLHHPLGMLGSEDRGRNLTNRSPYEPPFPLPPASQGFNSMGPGFPNRFDSSLSSFSRDNSGTQPLSHTPVNASGRKSANANQLPAQTSVVKPPQKQSAPPLVPMGGPQQTPSQASLHPTPPQSHRATTPHSNNPSQSASSHSQVNQSRPSKQPSRSGKHPTSKKSKTMPFMEVDSNLSNSIFETNRSMTPFFQSMQTLSPQSRAMQHEGTPFQPGNFFGLASRFPNSNTPMPKNSEIGTPFGNPLFPPRGAQNGLGLNFQPGFGMNMNPLHGNHGNAPQFTPHTAPHMANFNLNNFLSEGPSQNESSLPISPIKFGHTNSMLQHQGMDHNAMRHHHQYNGGHPGVMSINSILGSNHHGFDGRMNTSMAGPFHSHSHPSFIPPLNFSIHDH